MRWPVALAVAVVGATVLGAFTGWVVVRPGEQVVVRRFGRVVGPAWGPGFHWGLPLGLDRFDRVRTDEVRRLIVGPADPLEAGSEAHGGEFLTGDLNLVRIRAIVQYRVDDPVSYVVQGEVVEGAPPEDCRGRTFRLPRPAGDRRGAPRRAPGDRGRGRANRSGRR